LRVHRWNAGAGIKRLLEIFWARVRCLWWCFWRFQCEFLRDAKAITKVFYVDKLCR